MKTSISNFFYQVAKRVSYVYNILMFYRISWKLVGVGIIIALLISAIVIIFSKFAGGGSITVHLDRPAVIKQIRSLARLETASYTMEQIIDAKTNETGALEKFLFGDKLLLVAHGQVIAGFDLSQMSEADVKIENKSVRLTLPQPQILTTALDNSKTRVYNRSQGIFKRNDTELEAKARAEAEKSILKAACEGGILDTASENAKRQITALLQGLGFETVTLSIPKGECKI